MHNEIHLKNFGSLRLESSYDYERFLWIISYYIQIIIWSIILNYGTDQIVRNVLIGSFLLFVILKLLCFYEERNNSNIMMLVNVTLFLVSLGHYFWIQGFMISKYYIAPYLTESWTDSIREINDTYFLDSNYVYNSLYSLLSGGGAWCSNLGAYFTRLTFKLFLFLGGQDKPNLYFILLISYASYLSSTIIFTRIVNLYLDKYQDYFSRYVLAYWLFPLHFVIVINLLKDVYLMLSASIVIYYLLYKNQNAIKINTHYYASYKLLMLGLLLGYMYRLAYGIAFTVVIFLSQIKLRKFFIPKIIIVMLALMVNYNSIIAVLYNSLYASRVFTQNSVSKFLFDGSFMDRVYLLPLKWLILYTSPMPIIDMDSVLRIGEWFAGFFNTCLLPVIFLGIYDCIIDKSTLRTFHITLVQMTVIILTAVAAMGFANSCQRYEVVLFPVYMLFFIKSIEQKKFINIRYIYIVYIPLLLFAIISYIFYKYI